MPKNHDDRKFSREVEERLADLAQRLRNDWNIAKVWKRLLSDKERTRVLAQESRRLKITKKQLEEYVKKGHFPFEIILAWSRLRQVNPVRATVDLAQKVNLIFPNEHTWLLEEIGEAQGPANYDPKPEWNKDRGELRYLGQRIRKVRGHAVNVIRILNAFQAQGWPERIADPLPGRLGGPDRLRDAIKSLDRGIELVHFRADGTGTGVVWELA